MSLKLAYLPLPAALVWIACRDEQATENAISLNSDREVAVAILTVNPIGVWDLVTDPETGQTAEVLKSGVGPRLALERALKNARINAFGDNGSGRMEEIPVWEWTWMTINFRAEVSRGIDGQLSNVWKHVVVPTDKLLELFPSKAIIPSLPERSRRVEVVSERGRSGLGRPGNKLRKMEIALRARMDSDVPFSDRLQARAWILNEFSASKSYVNQALKSVDWTEPARAAKNSTKKSAEQ